MIYYYHHNHLQLPWKTLINNGFWLVHFLEQWQHNHDATYQQSCILALCSLTTTTASTGSSSDPGNFRGSNLRALRTNLYTCVDCMNFIFSFAESCILQGYTKTTNLLLEYCDGSSIKLDISCTSEYNTDGFSNMIGFGPNKGDPFHVTELLNHGSC